MPFRGVYPCCALMYLLMLSRPLPHLAASSPLCMRRLTRPCTVCAGSTNISHSESRLSEA